MSLHEQAQQFLRDIDGFPSPHMLELEAYRALVAGTAISDPPELASIEDLTIAGPHGAIPLRIYRPSAEDSLPVIVFFHGGGFVLCDIEKYDPMCCKLAASSGCAVVSVDYRLAPEARFPVAAEEAIFATEWVSIHAERMGFDPAKLIAAGDSAGGNLAAVAAQRARKNGKPAVAFQILICPLTDHASDSESRHLFASGYFLNKVGLDFFEDHYLRDASDRDDPLASPLRGDFTGLPPALVLTAEYDPLRDEGEQYARKLAETGVQATVKRYPGMIHGFYAMTDFFDDAHVVYEDIRRALWGV